ncbi:NifB/NifX family molybdenum-iron cluster-binding protein [candidate division CSSED10-310 bacterium]|uniref:NifB/NifX family molybdenum-iron cluster-binding protein n=1 Tax=candidate division CSSED10-310 bacterium TaxID=2855610 RepID=A0ABV6YXL7_UNCC1
MKIALSSQGINLDSPIDPRFGRAAYFLFIDSQSENIEVVDNNLNVNAAHGAGIQTAQTVINKGASVVITGNVGPKAYGVLQKSGVDVITGATGTCRESFRHYKEGRLKSAQGPTSVPHSG